MSDHQRMIPKFEEVVKQQATPRGVPSFEDIISQPTSKKKDFSLQSQISSVEDLPIGENISDQESQSISGTTDDKTNRILSRAVAPNVSKKEIKPPLKPIVLEPKEGEISITANGNKFVISPERLPAEYPKTREGALKYAQDKSTSLLTNSINKNSESYIQTVKDVAKISELRRLENNSSVVSQKDVAKINQLLGTKIESVDEDILQLLKDKKKQLEQKRLFPDEGTTPNLLELNKDINLVSSLIKKAGNNLQKEQIGNGEVPVLQGDVRSDLKAAFSGMENEAKEYLQRINMENVSNEMATGLEALRYTDPLEYERLKSRIKEGKTISSAKAAQLVNSGASIIDARNLESLEKGEIDLDEYARKKQDIAKKVDENFYKRPDILQKQVAEVIAEHYAKKSNPILGKWYVTDREIDAVPEEEFELAGIDINRPEVQSVIKNIKKNEGILPFDNAIHKDDLMREAAKGFSQPIRGAVNTVSGIGISNEQKRLQSELAPISNYVRKRTEYFDKNYGGIADAFNGLGQFVSQYLLMEGTVGLFKGIGKGLGGSTATTLVKTPEAIEAVALREGNKLGNYIIDKSQLWGQLAVPFISTYDDYYKSALEKTDNPLAATASAFVNASMEALSEQMFDNVKFGRQVIKNFNNSVANIENIAKIFDKGVWDEVTQKEFKKTIKEGFENALKATAKGTVDLTKEAFEEIPVAFTNFVTDALVNPKSVENRDVLEEMKDSFLSGLVSFSIPSLIGVGGRLNKEFNNNTTQSDALMIAARNRDSVVDAIYNDFENGNLTQSDVNEKMKILNESSYALKRLPERYITGNPMEEGDKSKYLGLSVKENLLRSQNKSLEKDDPIYKANEETIKKINQEKNKILNKEGEEDNTDEETKLSPEEAIKKAADEGVLTGVEGEMIKNGTITPEHGLFELAKQKYGVSDDGTVFPEGGRDISMKTSLDVDAAVTDAFPTKESVISEIKKQAKQTATTEGLKEGEQPTVSESGEVENKTGLVLYHGSPHSFENFDISKLGSGEGAQAFGHGLYFTNEVDIAKGYANKLGSRKNFWEALQNGQELSLSKEDYEFINKEIDALGFDGGRAESEDLGTIIVDGKEEYAPAVLDAMSVLFGKNAKSEIEGYDLTKEQIDRLFTIKKKISDPQLYKVAVHEGKSPSEYDYIDWREPLTESQRKKIGGLREGTTGEQAYKILSKEFGGDQKASEFLLSKGIDGITYKSQKGTGGKTGEGRNYVVFDAKSIRVDEINEQKQLQEQKPSTVSEPLEGKGEVSTGLGRGDVEVSDREMYDAVGKDATDYVKKSESQLGDGVINRNRVIETAKRIAKADGKSKVDVAAVAEAVQYETGYENKFDDLRKAGEKETIKRMIDVGVDLPKDIIDKFKEPNYTINKEKGDYGIESYDLKSDYGKVSGNIGDAYDWKNNKKVDGKEISVARIDAKEIGKGQGEELLKSVIDYANKNDIKYIGSTSLNEASRRTFEKLEKQGLIKPALEGVNNKTITWEIIKDQSISPNIEPNPEVSTVKTKEEGKTVEDLKKEVEDLRGKILTKTGKIKKNSKQEDIDKLQKAYYELGDKARGEILKEEAEFKQNQIAETDKINKEFKERAYQGLSEQEKFEAIIEDKAATSEKLTPDELKFVNENYFAPEGYRYNENFELTKSGNKSQSTQSKSTVKTKEEGGATVKEGEVKQNINLDSVKIFRALSKKESKRSEAALKKIPGVDESKIKYARYINDNFEKIVNQLSDNNKLKQVCP